jgi:hypothetical protein
VLVGTGRLTIVPGQRVLHQSEAGGLWGVELDSCLTCWWSTRAMIGVATEPPSFFEIPALKRVAPVPPATVARDPGGTPPPDAVIATAYAPEHAPAERDNSAQEQEQLRALLSELLQIHAQEPSAAAQSAAAAINWGGRVVSDGLLGMAELGTAGLEAALGKFKVSVEPKPTPTTVGRGIEPPTRSVSSPSCPTLTFLPHPRTPLTPSTLALGPHLALHLVALTTHHSTFTLPAGWPQDRSEGQQTQGGGRHD